MKKAVPAGRQGFTMIEIMVILAVTGVVMISVMGILSGTFKANNRVKWANKVEQEGTFVLGELRRNILNAKQITNCGIGSSVAFNNADDGDLTTIICDTANKKISSASAMTTIDLTSSQVVVSGCDTFVTCDTLPYSGEVSNVKFNFNLSAGITAAVGETSPPENYVTRNFESSVTVRIR